jgi:hypothetical protein
MNEYDNSEGTTMRSSKIFVLFAALFAAAWLLPREATAQDVSVSYQRFYDDLSPYGTWVEYPNYGYVWIPSGVPGFSPYATGGHWVLTDDGWTWDSDYPWGWAAFHYGRWDYDNDYGWFWVPDDEWGPAWVSWRRSPGYYGWAPLRPGISVSVAFGGDYHEQNERWIFVRDRDITRHDVSRHYVNRSRNVTIINNSTVIVNTRRDDKRNVTYISGPDRSDVQKVTHTTVKPVAIRETDQPGRHQNNGELQIYRPKIQKSSGNGQSPAPTKVMKLNEVKPASGKIAGNRQEQPRPVNPPAKIQPQPAPNVHSSESTVTGQQPRTVNPPPKSQPSQPRSVSPSVNKRMAQQPGTVNPPPKSQPSQPRSASPSVNNRHAQQPSMVKSPAKSQPPRPRNVAPPKKTVKPQPSNPNPPERKEK